jgi:hypothetical protein
VRVSRRADVEQHAPGSCPPSVRYACVLLSIQAGLWALASLSFLAVSADPVNWQPVAMRSAGHLAWYIVAGIGAVALAASLSAVSFLLADRVERAMSRARVAAVGLEAAMTCFGVLIAYYTAAAGAGVTAVIPVLAGLSGSALSLAATAALLGRPARAFTQPGNRRAALDGR